MARLPVILKNNKGQALIESLALFLVLLATLSVGFALVYFGLVHVGMNYLLHEFLICKMTQNNSRDQTFCHKEFVKKSQAFLIAGQVMSFESTRHSNTQKVRVIVKMPLNHQLKMQKELELYQ